MGRTPPYVTIGKRGILLLRFSPLATERFFGNQTRTTQLLAVRQKSTGIGRVRLGQKQQLPSSRTGSHIREADTSGRRKAKSLNHTLRGVLQRSIGNEKETQAFTKMDHTRLPGKSAAGRATAAGRLFPVLRREV